MNERTDDQKSDSRAMPSPASSRRSNPRRFDGGDPDPEGAQLATHPGSRRYIRVGGSWLDAWVVAASIIIPILVVGALLAGLPPWSAAVMVVVLGPLRILARAVARRR
jgi:hypothetical protein